VDKTVELDPRVIVDRDADGVAIGVELLGAARHGIPTGLLASALGNDADEQEIADAAPTRDPRTTDRSRTRLTRCPQPPTPSTPSRGSSLSAS